MKEKILTILVVASLVLSVFNLVLLLRTNGMNIIGQSTIGQSAIDTETIKADSFELEVKDYIAGMPTNYGKSTTYAFNRMDNKTELDYYFVSTNATLTSVDKTAFLNYTSIDQNVANPNGVFRCQNTFYICLTYSTPTYNRFVYYAP